MSTAAAIKPSTAPSLTIKRRFNAAPEKVFSAWTDAEKMKGWMGPGEIFAKHTESDPRVGGCYRIIMQAPSGEEFDVSGVFREVIANEKLVYTWGATLTPENETLITVTFKRDGDGTLLTLTHEQFPTIEIRDSHNGGWNGALEKLATFLEKE
ncbi:MAG: SRPBCC domain-containing protein [Pseudolabrys sp.]|jgi:uncharacterized protein YndB with AHSA1/START domain